MRTIYIDVLIVLNIYINYFLLLTVSQFTHTPLRKRRCILASAYGSLFSLLILAPQLNTFLNLFIKTVACVSITAVAFGVRSLKRLLKNTLVFLGVNFIFAGAVYAVYSCFEPEFLYTSNFGVYIDFSMTVLIITTALLYFLISILKYFFSGGDIQECTIIVRYDGRERVMNGLADTGNSLRDYFTGVPVMICSQEDFSSLTGYSGDGDSVPRGFRLLPCSTVSADGLIPVFRPDEVTIRNDLTGETKKVNVMLGVGNSNGRAIFNPEILL